MYYSLMTVKEKLTTSFTKNSVWQKNGCHLIFFPQSLKHLVQMLISFECRKQDYLPLRYLIIVLERCYPFWWQFSAKTDIVGSAVNNLFCFKPCIILVVIFLHPFNIFETLNGWNGPKLCQIILNKAKYCQMGVFFILV